MSIDFSEVALWPSAKIKYRQDAFTLYLIFVEDEDTFNSIPSLLQATDMVIIVAKIGDSFFAKVVDDSGGTIVNKHAITNATLIDQFDTNLGDSDSPIENPTTENLQEVTDSELKISLTNYLISNLSKQLDIYFQPGLTWMKKGEENGKLKGETQGVALLFLENYTDSSDNEKLDFRELVKGLVRWVWAAAGISENALPLLADVQAYTLHLIDDALPSEGNSQVFVAKSVDTHTYNTRIFDADGNMIVENTIIGKMNDESSADPTLVQQLDASFGSQTNLEFSQNSGLIEKIKSGLVQYLYREFTTTSLSYTDLRNFLAAHYLFKIQECSTDMEGTVFPMFPHLDMKVGTNEPVNFSQKPQDVDKQLKEDDINRLKNYYNQLQVKFGAESPKNVIIADSVTEFLFVGYARLLIRNGLQAIIDHPKPDNEANNLVTLLDEGLSDPTYRNIAQMASRFLLNGFNLPENFFRSNEPTADEGLYVSTRQQYTFSDSGVPSDTPTEYRVTLQMGDVEESFISFPDGKPQIVYSIPGTTPTQTTLDFLKLANELNGLTKSDIAKLHSAQPKLIPPYRTENLHFALRNRVLWGDSTYLLPLPTSLLHHLEQYEPNPRVYLRRWPNSDPMQAVDVPNKDFTWATRIDLTLQRVPDPSGDGFLKETYEIGSSSEKDKDLLEAVWNFLYTIKEADSTETDSEEIDSAETDSIELNLLYISDMGGGTTNPTVTQVLDTQDDILLLKTNLSTERKIDNSSTKTTDTSSTETSDTVKFSAKLSSKQEFLKLLWEALDVDTGGFYLYIPQGEVDLDKTVFKGNNSAVFPFLIEFTESSDPIYDFNNYAVFEKEINVETDLVLARSDKSVPVLMIPPGFLGFQIDDRLEATYKNKTGLEELNVLYQLLGWQVTGNTHFNASNPGLPIGPTSSYDLKVIPPDSDEELPIIGKQLVAIKKTSGLFKVRVFNINEEKVSKNNDEFTPDSQLASDLEAALDQSLSEHAKQTLIQGIFKNLNYAPEWLYERLVPVFQQFTPPPVAGPSDLPPQNKDPYLGIGVDSELNVKTWWQDIYGNQLMTSKAEHTFPIRYTDALIGINQWPSVSENYEFVQDNGSRKLNLSFVFDPTPYALASHAAATDPAASRANRIKADIAAIEKVYYQLKQTDVGFKVTTSIDDSWVFVVGTKDKERIRAFIDEIYRYLDGSLKNTSPSIPKPYTQDIGADEINIRQDFIIPVTVKMEMSRDFEFVSDDLKQTIKVTGSQSLSQLAESFTAVDLLLANADRSGLFNPETVLNPIDLSPDLNLLDIDQQGWTDYKALSPVPTLTIEAAETPGSLAKRFNEDMEAKLGRTVNFTVADLAAIIANDITVLQNDAELLNGRMRDEYENVLRAPANLSPKFEGGKIKVKEGQSLAQLTIPYILLFNSNNKSIFISEIQLNPINLTPNLDLLNIDQKDWTDYKALSPDPIVIKVKESPQMLSQRFREDMEQKLNRAVNFTVADLAVILAGKTNILSPKAVLKLGMTEIEVKEGSSLDQLADNPKTQLYTAIGLLLTNTNNIYLFNAQTVLNPINLDPDLDQLNIDQKDWTDYKALSPAPIELKSNESPHMLAQRFRTDMEQKLNHAVNFSVADLAILLVNNTKVLAGGSEMPITSLSIKTFAQNFQAAFPGLLLAVSENRQNRNRSGISQQPLYVVRLSRCLFRLDSQVINDLNAGELPSELHENLLQLDELLTGNLSVSVEEIEKKWKITDDGINEYIIMVEDQALNVYRGANSITYNIQESQPVYYAIPPLSNVLLSGQVAIDDYIGWKNTIPETADLATLTYEPITNEGKQFNAIDLNVLTRNFLVAVENFLDPATLIPANKLLSDQVNSILEKKSELAHTISKRATPILKNDIINPNDPQKKQKEEAAQDAIEQELLVDLVQGYDIETIVQFDVDVTVNNPLITETWSPDSEPRIIGKAKVVKIDSAENLPDIKLSTGKIPLLKNTGTSHFTYLFDTKTPELFANLKLNLQFSPTEVEYDIQTLPGITDRQASNFLNFVLPEGLEQSMGSSAIPIPLREYPAPPSLILQKAEPDPTSLTELSDVRQWQYTIIYEHPDISQDSIDCILQLNVPPIDDSEQTESDTTTIEGTKVPNLFECLVNFGEVYPQIAVDLNGLRNGNETGEDAKKAIVAFTTLVKNVTKAWGKWTTDIQTYTPAESDLHFVISERTLSEVDGTMEGLVTILKTVASNINGPAIEPSLELPGYQLKERHPPDIEGKPITFKFMENTDDQTFFGDSSIPDRKFMIENLDVIEHHNAWARIWLSRNKDLIRNSQGIVLDTNPAFVFQTPAVGFKNMATPFITNDEPWDIATLDSEYDLILMHADSVEDLPLEGERLVIVAKIDDDYHFRIFDRTGNRVINKGKDDFLPDAELIQQLDKAFSNRLSIMENLIQHLNPRLPTTTEEDQLSSSALTLISRDNAGDLPTEGERLVIVAKIDDDYHLRIFDKTGNQTIDEGKDEFLPDEELVLQLDEAFISRSELIQRSQSNLHYPLDLYARQIRTLETHLRKLFITLFPTFLGNQYEIRLSCRYAFSLSTGRGLNEDLVTTLPILLAIQITPDALANKNDENLSYSEQLSKEIANWLQENRPSMNTASLIFTVDLFSKLNQNTKSSLPTLRITHLELKLADVINPTRLP